MLKRLGGILMQTSIETYWNNNPCTSYNVNFPFSDYAGKKVLEIGCGGGMDAFMFCKRGADYTGIDLTDKAVEITKKRIHGFGQTMKMNAEYLDFPDNYFDLVYSFGVIHHTVNPNIVIKEIHRVLKIGGKFYVMLYNKFSFRYLVEIPILRRILWFLHYYKFNKIRKVIPHPTKEQWLSINTDNIGCPMSRAYTKKEAEGLFKEFRFVKSYVMQGTFGWFRIIEGIK